MKVSKRQEAIEDTNYSPSSTSEIKKQKKQKKKEESLLNQQKLITATQGSLLRVKRKIWKDKLGLSEKDILTTQLLETLDRDLTSKEKDLIPWWTSLSKEKSERLWLPIKTDYVDSVLNSYKTSSGKALKGNSWFSIKQKTPQKKNLQMTSSQSLQFSLLDSTDVEVGVTPQRKKSKKKLNNFKKKLEGNLKTLQIRVFPDEKEKEEIKRLEGQARWFYNAALCIHKKEQERWKYNCVKTNLQVKEGDIKIEISINEEERKSLRDVLNQYMYYEYQEKNVTVRDFKFVESRNEKLLPPWLEEKESVHNRIPRGGVKMYEYNYGIAMINFMAGNVSKFEMKPKTKSSPMQTIFFDDSNFPVFFKNLKSRYTYSGVGNGGKRRRTISFKDIFEQSPNKRGFNFTHNCVLNTYYINYCVERDWFPKEDRRKEKQFASITTEEHTRIISLDPGVRKFLVGYDPKGSITIVGEGAKNDILDILSTIDLHKSILAKENTKKQKEIIVSLWFKLKCLVKELHFKTINFLLENYDTIIYPDFKISQMVKKSNLSRETKRLMYSFSFFKFKTLLKEACKWSNKQLYIVDESFTSKTCFRCGSLNDMKGGEIYRCSECNLICDRDILGATNIFLKNISF